MKPTALVICPGRGTYQKTELGCLTPFYQSSTLQHIDQQRQRLQLPSVSELDQAARYLPALHQQPANNAALIFATGLCQFTALADSGFDVVAVTGNSMGWYTSLSCAGVWSTDFATEVVSTMASLTALAPGQQFIYPIINEHWQRDPERYAAVQAQLAALAPDLSLSIQYGGYAVLAGTNAAVQQAMAALPLIDDRFPLLLSGHAAFHTSLMQQAAQTAIAKFGPDCFSPPQLPLIDGCGRIWPAKACDLQQLQHYTFDTQVQQSYHFSQALQVAVKEFAPDRLILLGPGQNLGGAVAQSLIEIGWQGLASKQDFIDLQASTTPLVVEAAALLSAEVR